MKSNLSISIVIPTRNRSLDLARCLKAVKEQTRKPDDVIVVIGPGDKLSAKVFEDIASLQVNWRCLYCEKASVVTALNQGIAESKGGVIVFIDDDAEAPPDWLSKIESHYLRSKRVCAVGGRDRIMYPDHPELAHITNPRTMEMVGKVSWSGVMHGNHHCGSVISPLETDFIKGVNFSFRRSALIPCRIDDYLIYLGAEVGWEIDICLRIRKGGGTVIYDNDAWLYHHDGKRMAGDERENFSTSFALKRTDNMFYLTFLHLKWSQLCFFILRDIILGSRFVPGGAFALFYLIKLDFGSLSLGMKHRQMALKGCLSALRLRFKYAEQVYLRVKSDSR